MECRSGCGACCIAPSIAEPFHGMPAGKPAGVPCVHLRADARCGLWGRAERPAVCAAFAPEAAVCGRDRDEALHLIARLETATA